MIRVTCEFTPSKRQRPQSLAFSFLERFSIQSAKSKEPATIGRKRYRLSLKSTEKIYQNAVLNKSDLRDILGDRQAEAIVRGGEKVRRFAGHEGKHAAAEMIGVLLQACRKY